MTTSVIVERIYRGSETFGGQVPPHRKSNLRTVVCPCCGYSVQTGSPGDIWCGPHVASFGDDASPKVRMVPISNPGKGG